MKTIIDNSDFKLINNKLKLTNNLYKDKQGFILFYSRYCLKCNKVKEYWEEFQDRFNNIFLFLAVDCDDLLLNNDICCMNLKIKYYPTIKYFFEKRQYYKL